MTNLSATEVVVSNALRVNIGAIIYSREDVVTSRRSNPYTTKILIYIDSHLKIFRIRILTISLG